MSTFILALLEILSDIKYFLVVLVVVIFMFGDMFHLAVSRRARNVTFTKSIQCLMKGFMKSFRLAPRMTENSVKRTI